MQTVMYSMMTRSVQNIFEGSYRFDDLCVNPELVENIELVVH